MAPEKHEGCLPVKPVIPAVLHRPHPDYPGSVATYLTCDGKALPLWDEDEIAYTREVIALWLRAREQAA
jgi:hypothetical protein